MRKSNHRMLWAALLLCGLSACAFAAETPAEHASDSSSAEPQSSTTTGSVTVEGQHINYKAVAGTLILHGDGNDEKTPTASIFYVAYFKQGADAVKRPVTFIYNGGPGGSSFPLHMGAFGPWRINTDDHTHTPAAPYQLLNNEYSLLDASDLVFIDAPGTGFSRLVAQTKDESKRAALMEKRGKEFFSVDGDAQAFAQFITNFLSTYERWNSPKYLYGESYGTTRSVLIANILENQDSVDVNGVILQSQILNFNTSVDGASGDPGIDLPYALALPTYAATAWYHRKLPQRPAELQPLLAEVEQYAMGPYTQALLAGGRLDATSKQAVAEKLHQYTGLPVAYLVKANLRVDGGMFEHELLGDSDTSTGRLDTRFSGPSMDPMGKDTEYDPLMSGIASAYVSLFNDYVRTMLKFGHGQTYRMFDRQATHTWDFKHPEKSRGTHGTNVMPDLAEAMKANPNLKIMMNGGYFDLATPFYAAEFELDHLAIPNRLRSNISVELYDSGHMIYVHVPALKKLHDNVAHFIETTHG